MVDAQTLIPILVSALALAVSVLNLYVTRFRPARLQLIAGEHIHMAQYQGGRFSLTVPVSIANAGSTMVTVDRVALLIQATGSAEGYLLEPAYYMKLSDTGNFVFESTSVPITVGGVENVTKQILFTSSLERPAEFQLYAGSHDLTLLAWARDQVKPRASDTFSIILSSTAIAEMAANRDAGVNMSTRLPQSKWRAWAAHHLTEVEVAALARR